MAQFGQDQQDIGRLSISEIDPEGAYTFYFIPNLDKVPERTRRKSLPKKVTLARANPERQYISIYPINTLAHHERFLTPKYRKIHTISVEGSTFPPLDGALYDADEPSLDNPIELLQDCLPKGFKGFIRDYRYGLGLTSDANFLIKEIEEATNIDTIIFDDSDEIRLEGSTIRFSLNEYDEIIREIERIKNRGQEAARRVKSCYAHNVLATPLSLEPKDYSLGRHPHSRIIALAADGKLDRTSANEIEILFSSSDLSSKLRKLSARSPERLPTLRNDVELISLEHLISKFEKYLTSNHSEKQWQAFFRENLFALQQVFGMPTTLFSDEVTVGGRGFEGAGDKIVDFMFKNTLTNNISLVEIKKPGMPLLSTDEYRKGVYGPHKDLNNAITQALDQRHHLLPELPTLKMNSRRHDLESYDVRCIVIAGRTPPNDEIDKLKSLELFRNNLRTVTIVTYDEILESLKSLHKFLSNVNNQEKKL